MMISIDGRSFDCADGETILAVARREGIEIPALCEEERLDPFDSCGVCVVQVEGRGVVKACSTPVEEGMVVTVHAEAADDVRKTALELLLSNHWGDCVAPCKTACPAHTDCQGYVSLTANGRFLDGLKLLYENLPLPASFGRICPAPCEDACRREIAEEPVQIRHVKRVLADRDFDYVPPTAPSTGHEIGVVGGGPAGLSAAYFLRRHGHGVTVYDAMPDMGGMLRYGIPEYRLPHEALVRDLDVLRRMGIRFRNNVRLGGDLTIAELEERYDAVFLGLGAWGTRGMGLPGEDNPAVMQGTDFLRHVNDEQRPTLPRSVAVIGGGNTAMDAARCARRLGAEVTVVYRRTLDEMPAIGHEVHEAEAEGVTFEFLAQPLAFVGDGVGLRGIECIRMKLGEPDETGRRRPVPVEGSEFTIPVGAAILAVGQVIDSTCLQKMGIVMERNGAVVVENESGSTSRPRVYAGGDMVTGPAIAVDAIGSGHRAADAIDRLLRGIGEAPRPIYSHVKFGVTRRDIGNPAKSPQIRTSAQPASERITSFDEYEAKLTDQEGIAAAQRCLECGCLAFNDCALRSYATEAGASQWTYEGDVPRSKRDERHPFIWRKAGKCISCGRCIRVCSDVCGVAAIDFVHRGIRTEVQAPFNRAWQDSACVACGACVDVCPTGALYDRNKLEKQIPVDLTGTRTTCVLCGLGCDIDVQDLNGTYMRTKPANGSDVLCARGRYGWHTIADGERIVEPMIRSGSSLRSATWEEALHEAGARLADASGSVTVFGTGLLTLEEGWILSRIADQLAAGAPIFDINDRPAPLPIPAADVVTIDALDRSSIVVVIGPRNGHRRVALDVLLRERLRAGARVIDLGDELDSVPATLNEIAPKPDDNPLILFEEQSITADILAAVAGFVVERAEWKVLFVPVTANAIGLRRLGFGEHLRRETRAWLTVGVDPVAHSAGRQRLLNVDTLVALTPVHNRTTQRADVVFPMCMPYETRGHVIGARGEKALHRCGTSVLERETWEVLMRLGVAVGAPQLPWRFESLTSTAIDAVATMEHALVNAGGTSAQLADLLDERLQRLGI